MTGGLCRGPGPGACLSGVFHALVLKNERKPWFGG